MEPVLTAISTVGFPIVAVIGCCWFIYTFWKKEQEQTQIQLKMIIDQSQKREDRLYEQIDKFSNSLDNFNTTLNSIDKRLAVIESKESN